MPDPLVYGGAPLSLSGTLLGLALRDWIGTIREYELDKLPAEFRYVH